MEWPADAFALTHVILEHAQAFRFALSPPAGQQWPPAGPVSWSSAVDQAARQWMQWAEERLGPPPELIAREWGSARRVCRRAA